MVWAGEFKNGLRFEIRPSYDGLPMRSQLVTHRQSSCSFFRETAGVPIKNTNLLGIVLILTPRSFGAQMVNGVDHFCAPAISLVKQQSCKEKNSWIADQPDAHEKSISQATRRVTTIPRPPLESSRRGEFRSEWSIFV